MADQQTNSDFLTPTANANDNIDIGKLLQRLMENNSTNNNISPTDQIQQDVATKEYTNRLKDHAQQTPDLILKNLIDQWGQAGGGDTPQKSSATDSNGNMSPVTSPAVTSDAVQTLSGLPGVSQDQTSVSPNNQQPVNIDDQIANIDKQIALNISKRNLSLSQPPDFWQRFGQNFNKMTGGVTQADQLVNMAAGQKIAGQEPLQPKDIGELNAGSYKAALEATGTALTATQQKLTALTDLYGKEEQNKGVIASTLKQESPNQAVLRTSIENTADNMVTHVKNFRNLISNRPTFNTQGINAQAQQTSSMIQQGKVGKYTLVKK